MSRFRSAVKAEFLKVTTTKMWWILGLIMVVYLGFTGATLGFTMTWAADLPGVTPLEEEVSPLLIYTVASSMGFLFPVLLGALSVSSEYRYRTIIPTFLTVADRWRALRAKLTVQFLFGLLFGVAAFASTIVATVFFFVSKKMETGLADAATWEVIGRSVLVMALWAVIGVGVGALVPNQAAVIIIVIGFTQFLEPILRLAAGFKESLAPAARFLPGAVSDAFGGASFYSMMTPSGGGDPLEWWQAGLVLLGYAVLAVGAGYWLKWRRDVS